MCDSDGCHTDISTWIESIIMIIAVKIIKVTIGFDIMIIIITIMIIEFNGFHTDISTWIQLKPSQILAQYLLCILQYNHHHTYHNNHHNCRKIIIIVIKSSSCCRAGPLRQCWLKWQDRRGEVGQAWTMMKIMIMEMVMFLIIIMTILDQ